jgi:HSP20 family protein
MDDFVARRARPWWPERWSLPAVLDIEPPVVDFYDEKDDLVVKAELPGMEKQDIEVNVTDHTLTIKGEKKKAAEIEEENYYQSERYFGSFHRRLELPSDVQAEKAKASFKNGILEVRLPKTEVAKPKEIKVAVEEGPITSVGQN